MSTIFETIMYGSMMQRIVRPAIKHTIGAQINESKMFSRTQKGCLITSPSTTIGKGCPHPLDCHESHTNPGVTGRERALHLGMKSSS